MKPSRVRSCGLDDVVLGPKDERGLATPSTGTWITIVVTPSADGDLITLKRLIMSAATVATLALVGTGCAIPETEGTAADRTDVSGAAGGDSKQDKNKKNKKAAAPDETASQTQASRSAAQYLDTLAFSRKGLITQLVDFESFSQADAEYGVDAQKANWKKQAGLSAKQYLDTMGFSREGLITQLVDFEGFTQEQAEAGVAAVGL